MYNTGGGKLQPYSAGAGGFVDRVCPPCIMCHLIKIAGDRMLDNIWKKFKRDNDVTQEIENSPYVNIEGLEQKINVPEPTKADKSWARKIKNASSKDIATALITAIDMGQNWRVWYLVNRPLKSTKNLLGKIKNLGFDGNVRLKEGLTKAAEKDNVTAAYLLLKFAEKNQTAYLGPGDAAREEIDHFTRNGVIDAAEKPGSTVFTLLAKTFYMLTNGRAKTLPHLIDDAEVFQQAALRAAAQGNEKHLDAILDNNLLTSRQFVETYMDSFAGDATAQERKPFMTWLLRRGIVDQVFADEAAAVEVRVAAQKEIHRESLAKGWKQSARDFQLEDGTMPPTRGLQAEIAVRDTAGSTLVHVFNYNAERANVLSGEVVRSFAFSELPDRGLLEEGRAFIESCAIDMPQLVWKKGEPFRLRFKDQSPRS